MNTTKKVIRSAATITLAVGLTWTGLGLVHAAPAAASVSTSTTSSTSALTTANSIIRYGDSLLGTPYKFGSPTGITTTFDCSSFTQHVFQKHGIQLLRSSRQQVTQGRYVSKSNLRKGDLVFFSTGKSNGQVAHVGIYAGNNKFLHTYGSHGVTYSDMTSNWWSTHYITARRVIQ